MNYLSVWIPILEKEGAGDSHSHFLSSFQRKPWDPENLNVQIFYSVQIIIILLYYYLLFCTNPWLVGIWLTHNEFNTSFIMLFQNYMTLLQDVVIDRGWWQRKQVQAARFEIAIKWKEKLSDSEGG